MRSSARRPSVIAQLKKLNPTQFEHLIYDLLLLCGLRNAVWRTPGSDAGRDIEGQVIVVDLSENMVVERWYVECKRYAQSLDWPAVHQKIAYAHNHGADYLLFATTGTLSPRCKEEISRRDVTRERPRVRVWDAAVLEDVVMRHPVLLVKYGLTRDSAQVNNALVPLVNTTAKVVQAAYGRAVAIDSIDPGLEFSAALVDLISARLVGLNALGEAPVRRFLEGRDLYPWCTLSDDVELKPFDSYGLRALLAGLRFFAKSPQFAIGPSPNYGVRITASSDIRTLLTSGTIQDALVLIGLWSNLEVLVAEGSVLVAARRGGENVL